MPSFATRALTRVRGRLARVLRRVGYAAFGLGTALGLVVAALPEPTQDLLRGVLGMPLGSLGIVGLVGGALAFLFGRSTHPGEVRAPGAIDARKEGAELVLVFAGHEHRIPLASLERGHVVPEHRIALANATSKAIASQVVLQTRGGDVWRVEVGSVSEGLELLGAVGLGGRDRTLRVERRQGGTVILTTLMLFVVAPFVVVPSLLAAIALPPASVFVFAIALLLRVGAAILKRLQPGALAIGADGVSWGHGSKRRFVAHRDIEDARIEHVGALGHKDLVLRTKHGEVRIPLGPLEPEPLEATVAHVLAARGEAAAAMEAFARAGRSFDAWKRDVEALVKDDYRKARVPKVRVLETLEDPHAPADQRLGAALALTAESPELAAEVAREVARACADRELAEALEALADARLDGRRAEAVAGD